MPDAEAVSLRNHFAGVGHPSDIRNAVLKAALAAAAERGPDSAKRIHQRHLEASIEDVIAGKRVMRQSLFAGEERAASRAGESVDSPPPPFGTPRTQSTFAARIASLASST